MFNFVVIESLCHFVNFYIKYVRVGRYYWSLWCVRSCARACVCVPFVMLITAMML